MSELLLPVIELLLLPTGVLAHLCAPRGEGLDDGDSVTEGSTARAAAATPWTAPPPSSSPPHERRASRWHRGLLGLLVHLSVARAGELLLPPGREGEKMGWRRPVGNVAGAGVGGGGEPCSWKTKEGERALSNL